MGCGGGSPQELEKQMPTLLSLRPSAFRDTVGQLPGLIRLCSMTHIPLGAAADPLASPKAEDPENLLDHYSRPSSPSRSSPDPPLWAGSWGILHHHLHLPKPSLLLLGTHSNSSRTWQVRALLENPGDCKPLRGLSPHLQGPLCTSSTPFITSESLLCAN